MTDPIELDGESLTPEQVERVARDDHPVEIAEDGREAVRRARERVEDVIGGGEAVYGLNTGFGHLVDERIPSDRLEELQANLVRSHAAGAGRELTREEVRATMVTRVNALVKGYSGVREVVVDHLVAMLNEGVHPVVYSRGSLGASGDLAPLAHVALTLLGEGEADVPAGLVSNGGGEAGDDSSQTPDESRRVAGDVALASIGLEPLTLAPKEGLALLNGTQQTLGLAALVVVDAERAVAAADLAGAFTTEVTLGTTASADPSIQAVRPHRGQAIAARNLRRVTADSAIVESHRNCDRVQDAYSIRCIPQVHGAVRDAVAHLQSVVEIELNSATDNPLVFDAEGVDDRASGTDSVAVLSGGNFHGEPLALPLDYVVGALTDLAAISERRVDRLLNPNLQAPHLPPFLTEHSGLQSGYMMAQYTAAAMVNELRSMGRPASDNTPVSGNQEDHVSMSAQSALNARRAIENLLVVIATELVCAAQAREFVSIADDGTDADEEQREGDDTHVDRPEAGERLLGVGTALAYDHVREHVPPLEADRPIRTDVESVRALLERGSLLERVRTAVELE